ncbi:CxxH/CxxC protein [Ureibacillus terrenus]|uniref:CxxH/CxxC protein n=1 Tax=Ureibacillus terrenus TaxID=118246 RepID=UPI002E1BC5ED|nr:CxxH/CxxC protein [Ureibacillus terrenus]MED3763597.1 CxxH/CxxC protein [Ureibacillus terrenus]
MNIFCCEMHVNHALDVVVFETKEFPILEQVKEEEKLSTKCEYCEKEAKYLVSRK